MTSPVTSDRHLSKFEVRYLEKRFGKKYGWPDNDDVYNVNTTQLAKVNVSEVKVGKRTVYVISDSEVSRVNSKFSNNN